MKKAASVSVCVADPIDGPVTFELVLKSVTEKSIVFYPSISRFNDFLGVKKPMLQYVFNKETGKGRGDCAKAYIEKLVLESLCRKYRSGYSAGLNMMEVETGICVEFTKIYNTSSYENEAEWMAEAAIS